MRERIIDSFDTPWSYDSTSLSCEVDQQYAWRGDNALKIFVDIPDATGRSIYKKFDTPIRCVDNFLEFMVKTNAFGPFLKFSCGELAHDEWDTTVDISTTLQYQLVRVDLSDFGGKDNISYMKFTVQNQEILFGHSEESPLGYLDIDENIWGPGGTVDFDLWNFLSIETFYFYIDYMVVLEYESFDIGRTIEDNEGHKVDKTIKTVEWTTEVIAANGGESFCNIPLCRKANIKQLHVMSLSDTTYSDSSAFNFYVYERGSMLDAKDVIYESKDNDTRTDEYIDIFYEDLDVHNKLFLKIANHDATNDTKFYVKVKYVPML